MYKSYLCDRQFKDSDELLKLCGIFYRKSWGGALLGIDRADRVDRDLKIEFPDLQAASTERIDLFWQEITRNLTAAEVSA